MKKIFFYLCCFAMFGCSGYEPLFLSKNSSFYIVSIENINNDPITRKLSLNLNNSKLPSVNKKGFILKASSSTANNITSKNSAGDALTYEVVVNVKIVVFDNSGKIMVSRLNFNKSFNYNNQSNKFDLSQYKADILDNLINKISQDIVIKLQSL